MATDAHLDLAGVAKTALAFRESWRVINSTWQMMAKAALPVMLAIRPKVI